MTNLPIYISLGAGVQSSTMALMASLGELPGSWDVQGCIFADTQAESLGTYRWLAWLERNLSFPVHRVTAGNLLLESVQVRYSARTDRLYVREVVPAFLKMQDGSASMLWRRCTRDYKLVPILSKLKELACVPVKPQGRLYAKTWLGITTDEASRMKPSRESWVTNEYPLVEAGLSRDDCLAWLDKQGYPKPPRSSCVMCPYHSDREWQRLKDEEPEGFQQAVDWERRLQEASTHDERAIGVPFAWKGLVPLDEATFSKDTNSGAYLFNNECEGMCGV